MKTNLKIWTRRRLQSIAGGLFVSLCLVASAQISVAPPQHSPSPRKTLRVLFVGNSYTYFNNLPEMLEQLSESPGASPHIVARMVVAGGATLERHWDAHQALQAIQIGRWDYVVLQEQSTLGPTPLVDGLPRIRAPDNFFKYARKFDEAIRLSGACTVFFSTWTTRGAPRENSQAIDSANMQIARELNALVAPVGAAWRSLQKQDSRITLYAQDGSHPSPVGTYLAACVLYATLTGQNPEGLRREILGHAVDESGRVSGGEPVHLVILSIPEARAIQHAAWKAHQQLQAAGGYVQISAPVVPEPSALPAGHRPDPSELEGLWTGETRLFPQSISRPAKVELSLHRRDGEWQGDLKITLSDHEGEMTSPVTDFHLTDTGVSFTQTQGVKNATVKYTGSFTGKSLEGEAQIVMKNGSVAAMGRWNLNRRR